MVSNWGTVVYYLFIIPTQELFLRLPSQKMMVIHGIIMLWHWRKPRGWSFHTQLWFNRVMNLFILPTRTTEPRLRYRFFHYRLQSKSFNFSRDLKSSVHMHSMLFFNWTDTGKHQNLIFKVRFLKLFQIPESLMMY